MSDKLISIGYAAHNGEQFIEKSLESLLSQSYKNFELIISNDASSDTTEKICIKFADKDNRIKYFKQAKNLGLVENFAFVLSQAGGEYFMWAAQDDWWNKDFITKLVRSLESSPKYVVAMSHFKTVYPDREGTIETAFGKHKFTNLSNYELFKIMLSAKDNPIFEYGLWRTDFLRRLFARRKPKCIEDTVILISEAALAGKFFSVPEFLHIKYRDPRPIVERHYLGNYYRQKFPYTRFLVIMLFWLLSSRIIPARRKALIFLPWFYKVWLYKYKILNEFRALL